MIDIFSDDIRRNPYPVYDQVRRASPVRYVPEMRLWFLFDYDSVKRALTDHDTFSSRNGPADWMVFLDPPRHTKLRALISQAFTPRSVAALEPRIRGFARELLNQRIEQGEMDLAADFAFPLPMAVIAAMLGIPFCDRPRFTRWNEVILNMSYTVPGGRSPETEGIIREFKSVTVEMNDYLTELLAERRVAPKDDLLTRLVQAEVEGQRLTQQDILGFFQLLLLAGSETTTNLINNAIISFVEHPDQLARVKGNLELLVPAIEEVLRYRAPLQWMFRVAQRDVELQGQLIPAGSLVLVMIGAANRDPGHFPDPHRFDVTRDPNPHLAFGNGIHFCLGAPLARLEARIALTELLKRVNHFRFASADPWEPRKGLHVHGPTNLPLRFDPGPRLSDGPGSF